MHSSEWLFVVALVLYSVAIWGHVLCGEFRRWMLPVFGLAVLADISGTIFLCGISGRWIWTFHTVMGLLALLIMTLHLVWARFAARRVGRSAELFKKYSVWAWVLWLVAFFSRVPPH